MKKLVMALLSAALCVQLTACSMPTAGSKEAPNKDKSLEYFDAAMEASFLGVFDSYNEFVGGSAGESLYESEVASYVSGLMYWAAVEEAYIDDETYAGFEEVARTVLAKVKWEVVNVYAVDSENGYDGIIELYLYPTDLMDLMYDDVESAIDAYNEIASDYEYEELERLYGQMILEIAQSYADQAKPVSNPDQELYWYDYDGFGAVISDDDWSEVDMLIMDFDRL